MALISFDAFHGTSREGANSIIDEGFNESNKTTEWLGRGIYFFVEGISDPQENAKEWALAQGWDSNKKRFKYSHGAVVHAKFDVEGARLFDLTTTDGLRRVVVLRNKMVDRILAKWETDPVPFKEHTCKVFNMMVDIFKAHAVKQNLAIKSHRERVSSINVLIPNTTVLCVRKDAIDINPVIVSMEELK